MLLCAVYNGPNLSNVGRNALKIAKIHVLYVEVICTFASNAFIAGRLLLPVRFCAWVATLL